MGSGPWALPRVRGTWLDPAATLLAAAVVVATLLNGLPFYLRRIGLIDRAAYLADLARFCRPPIQHWWLPASCHFRKLLALQPLRLDRIDPSRLYMITGSELPLKLAKYGIGIALIAVSILVITQGLGPIPRLRQLRPALPLLLSLLISLLVSLRESGTLLTLLALLPLGWLPLMVLGGWLTTPQRLQSIADGITLLILVQIPLALLEAMRGLPIPFGPLASTIAPPVIPLPSRLAQSFVLPNTLGIFLVTGVGFCLAYSRRRWIPLLPLLTLPLLFLARSGTGLLLLIPVAGLGLVHQRRLRRPARAGSGALQCGPAQSMGLLLLLLALLAGALPRLLDRPDLYQSLLGRWLPLSQALQVDHPLQLLFGRGLARAGNVISAVIGGNHPLQPWVTAWVGKPAIAQTDSLLVVLLVQGGLLAVLAFYGLLLWGMGRDPQARPFLAAVLPCSLVMNLFEVFPLGILMALCLNRCLLLPDRAESPSPYGTVPILAPSPDTAREGRPAC
jgi:hypothetical protein